MDNAMTEDQGMTREEAIAGLRECQENKDTLEAHELADDVLCHLLETLGYGDVVAEWREVNKWYARADG